MEYFNDLGQRVGRPLPGWKRCARPSGVTLEGRFCRLEKLNIADHANNLFTAQMSDAKGANWTYLPYGPFESRAAYFHWLETFCMGDDPLFYAIIAREQNCALGLASFMRIVPEDGVMEVGHLNYSPPLQRTAASTEAMYLMMQHAFELGYRRYEWKCDSLNKPSWAAAERLGFTFEGLFRQSMVRKGRNRDTAWFSVIDAEWPILKEAFEQWLAPENFDAAGRQRKRLEEFRSPPASAAL